MYGAGGQGKGGGTNKRLKLIHALSARLSNTLDAVGSTLPSCQRWPVTVGTVAFSSNFSLSPDTKPALASPIC